MSPPDMPDMLARRRASREAQRLTSQLRLALDAAAQAGLELPDNLVQAALTVDQWAREVAKPQQ